jgi:propanol-preferring alcohol dehydrogenase
VLAPVECLVPFDGIDPWRAAPLTDAGLSSWHAVKRVLGGLGPGATAVVIGVGGLGHLAVAALGATCSAHIIAVDMAEEARALALRLGAHQSIAPEALEQIGPRADAVLDFVGSGDTVAAAARVIAPLGHIVVVGRGAGHFAFTHSALRHGARLSTSFGGSKAELAELLALMKAGAIVPEVTRFSLDDAEKALTLLAQGRINGRAVICP